MSDRAGLMPSPKLGEARCVCSGLADVSLGGAESREPAVTIPRAAVQSLADRSVVYVANPANDRELLERTVRLRGVSGDSVVVLAGLEPGEQVVTEGSFHVRAERERLGLGEPAPMPARRGVTAGAKTSAIGAAPQVAKITVTKDAFTPSSVVRPDHRSDVCDRDLVPSLKIKRLLPVNNPVDIDFTPDKAGTIDFVCGMNMLKGAIVVE